MSTAASPVIFMRDERLKAEAAIEPDPVSTGPVTSGTQIIAIYGKGGIGKSFTLANLSHMMAQQPRASLCRGNALFRSASSSANVASCWRSLRLPTTRSPRPAR